MACTTARSAPLSPYSRGATVAPPWHHAAALEAPTLVPLAFPQLHPHAPCAALLLAERVELPGERLHVLLQVRPGLGLRQALPPLLPGRVQRLVSLFAGLLHRLPAHIAQGSGTLLLGPEQHRIPPRIVRCLAPHVSQPLLVLGVPPDRLGRAAGLLHAYPAQGHELPGVSQILHAPPEHIGFGLRLHVGLPREITQDTILLFHTSICLHHALGRRLVPHQRSRGAYGGELCRHVHVVCDA